MESNEHSPRDPLPTEPDTADEAGAVAAVDAAQVARAPDDAMAANLEGKPIFTAVRGFGPLYQRRYQVRLPGLRESPQEVMIIWKQHFPAFQPPDNRFYPSPKGVKPGEVVFVDSSLVEAPGMRAMTEMASGVMITDVDDLSFTVMTPKGFPVAGSNTFSVLTERGAVVAQVLGLERTSDPLYEFGYRYLGGEAKQDATWVYVLRSLAAHFGMTADVTIEVTCLDRAIQWRNAANIRHNAVIGTVVHRITAPLRGTFGGT